MRKTKLVARLALAAITAAALSGTAASAASAASFSPGGVSAQLNGTLTFKRQDNPYPQRCYVNNHTGTLSATGANWTGNLEWMSCQAGGFIRKDWGFRLTPWQSPSRFYVDFQRYEPLLFPSTPWGTHWNPQSLPTFVNGTPAAYGVPEVQSTIVFDNTPVAHVDHWSALTVSGTLTLQKTSTTGSRLIKIIP